MNWQDFQIEARKTAIYPQTITVHYSDGNAKMPNYFYSALKLNGEIGELLDALEVGDVANHDNIVKELGDVCWYIADLCTIDGVALPATVDVINPTRELDQYSRRFSESLGKYMRKYDEAYLVQAYDHLAVVKSCLELIALAINVPMSTIFEINISKLTDRAERGVLHGSGDNR